MAYKRQSKKVTFRSSRIGTVTFFVRNFSTPKPSPKLRHLIVRTPITSVREIGASYKLNKRFTNAFQPRNMVANSIFVIGILGMALSLSLIDVSAKSNTVNLSSSALQELVSGIGVQPAALRESKPVNIAIDAINVNATVGEVGLNSDNTLETPSIFEDTTGWYKHSSTPGERGTSVIVGHVDNIYGPSVFWDLHTLNISDRIEIKRIDETTATFEVYEVRSYHRADFPTERVYGAHTKAELRLITCGGEYDLLSDNYSHNTIVFARLIQR